MGKEFNPMCASRVRIGHVVCPNCNHTDMFLDDVSDQYIYTCDHCYEPYKIYKASLIDENEKPVDPLESVRDDVEELFKRVAKLEKELGIK